jgi:O-phospho-L-seryl-tRNASec:L-selenocysteinyl-tRNA synthase
MGETTLRSLLKQRKSNFQYLKEGLSKIASKHGERVLDVPNNKISTACTLTALNDKVFKPNNIQATFFGSYLFARRVSGVRVCAATSKVVKFVDGCEFKNYGTHSECYPSLPYFTAAAAIG